MVQRKIDVIFASVKWEIALVSLNDVLLFSKTSDKYIKHIRSFSTLPRDVAFILELKNCEFFTSSLNYLECVISPRRLKIASLTFDAICNLKLPTTVIKLKSFFGICNGVRRLVRNFSLVAAPLNGKLRKDQPAGIGQLTQEETAVKSPIGQEFHCWYSLHRILEVNIRCILTLAMC